MYLFIKVRLPDFEFEYSRLGNIFTKSPWEPEQRAKPQHKDKFGTDIMHLLPDEHFTILAPTSSSYRPNNSILKHSKDILSVPQQTSVNNIHIDAINEPVPLSWIHGVHQSTLFKYEDLININYNKKAPIYTWSSPNGKDAHQFIYDKFFKAEYLSMYPFGKPPARRKGLRWEYIIIRWLWRCIVPWTPDKSPIAKAERHFAKAPIIQWIQNHRFYPKPPFNPPNPPTVAYDINLKAICTPASVYSLFRDMSTTSTHITSLKPASTPIGRKNLLRRRQDSQDHETRPLVFLDPSFGIAQFTERPLGNYEALELMTFILIFLASILYIFSVLRLYFIVVVI